MFARSASMRRCLTSDSLMIRLRFLIRDRRLMVQVPFPFNLMKVVGPTTSTLRAF